MPAESSNAIRSAARIPDEFGLPVTSAEAAGLNKMLLVVGKSYLRRKPRRNRGDEPEDH
jgi:hypothetical protein